MTILKLNSFITLKTKELTNFLDLSDILKTFLDSSIH